MCRGICDRVATARAIFKIRRETDRWRFTAGELIARNYTQTMRSRGRFDTFDHRQPPRRPHREHRAHAWRVQVRIDDCDLAALDRQRRRDINGEHTFADAAARARKRDGRANAGKVYANSIANGGDIGRSRTVTDNFRKYSHLPG